MRFNESQVQPTKAAKEPKPREMTKPGSYSSKDLENTKKVMTYNSGRK